MKHEEKEEAEFDCCFLNEKSFRCRNPLTNLLEFFFRCEPFTNSKEEKKQKRN